MIDFSGFCLLLDWLCRVACWTLHQRTPEAMMREEIFTLKLPAAKAPEFLHGITPNDFLAVAGDVG